MTSPTTARPVGEGFWTDEARRPSRQPATISVSTVPAVVDEVTVRLVAAGVLTIGVVAVLTQQWWLYALLLVDFAIRAARGPRFSPLAQFMSRVVRPLIPAADRPTAFAPKRFAAGIGAVMTAAISVLWLASLATGASGPLIAATVLAGAMIALPALEAGLGLCVGCKIFGGLIRVGLVPAEVCVDCGPQRAA